MDKPLEIEYKYLIRFPNIEVLKIQPEYKCEEMTQLYLELPKGMSEHGTRCRIRSVTDENGARYIRTFKESITDMTRIEIEDEISKEEFDSLSRFIREGYAPIKKHRHSFSLFGFVYEVDVFPFWEDRAYLEVEVDSEKTQPPIPEFIHIIKDVTADKRYRNTALAQKIITEEI
ncbi:MAG: CYTH domain-containing protein [Ruminococcus sp.]|nr:CYTH domain-containing protein [Ruminococcus sp.]